MADPAAGAGDWSRGDGATECENSSAADHELDAEVALFLATEFFASSADGDDSAAVAPSFESSSTTTTELALEAGVDEEMVFMDLLEPLDVSDLDRSGDVAESPSADIRIGSEIGGSSTLPATGADTMELDASLNVRIPASALVGPTLSHESAVAAVVQPILKKPRKRVKDELEYLRQQVKDFEDKLEKVRQGYSADAASENDSTSILMSSVLQTQSGSWESVAKRQEREKQRSRAENVKLKETLNNQLQLAISLSRLLETQQDLSWLETPPAGRATKRLCITSSTDESVFEMLAAQVETMYSEVDSALLESSRAGPEPGVKSDADGNVFIEFVDSSFLPFDFRNTASAMWKLVSSSTINLGNRQYQAISATDDTARARMSMKLRLRHQDSQVKLSYFGKRFVEADRVVIVWCSMSDSEEYLLVNENKRVRVHECGWGVIESASLSSTTINSDNTGGMGQPGTSMQTITRLTPELEMSGSLNSENSNDHVGLLTDVVLSLNHENLAALRQMIENLMLSGAAEHSS